MANFPIQVEYNHNLKSLENTLMRVKRPGDYYVADRLEVPLPTVRVDGVGTVSFPVPPFQFEQLIKLATRAPYGRGEETILDASVRQVWQITADQVSVGGKSWGRSFEAILSRVTDGLGCARAEVSAELYKLLVYDPGGFFKPHRDTEKCAGMFGTLVVALPSEHSDGEVVIRHAGREVRVALSQSEFTELAFAAFFADCEHEVCPISAGHRICLVYNLVQRPRGGKTKPPSAPVYESEVSHLAGVLQETLASGKAPLKIVWLLEHQYSPASLAFTALKNADAARTKVLADAAARAGCAVHLGIVHIEEYGSAIPSYEPYYDRRYGGWNDATDADDDLEDPEGDGSEDFEIVEVVDGAQFVNEWTDLDNGKAAFGPIPLLSRELVPAGALDGEASDKKRVTEATGNEGATFERSYHRAAVVVWHRSRYGDVLLQAGVGAVLPYLKQQVAACERAPKTEGARRETLALTGRMLDRWQASLKRSDWVYPARTSTPNRAEMLELLARLGDVKLIERFIGRIVTETYDGSENAAMAAAVPLLTPARACDLMSGVVRANVPSAHVECIDLLSRLVGVLVEGGVTPATRWKKELHEVAVILVAGLKDLGGPSRTPRPSDLDDPYWYQDEDWEQDLDETKTVPSEAVRASAIAGLLDALGRLASDLPRQAAAIIADRPAAFDPVHVVVPALDP